MKKTTKSEQPESQGKYFLKGGLEMLKIARNIMGLMLAVTLVFLLACGDASAGVKRIRMAVHVDFVNLDPAHGSYYQDRNVNQQVFEGLVEFDWTAKAPYPIIPVLAESYEISKDAKMITFKLRKGIQFHHGYGELTSEDVVFTYQRHLNPKVGSRARGQLRDIVRLEAVDKYTARMYLKNPTAFDMLTVMGYQEASFILCKKAFEKLGKKVEKMPVGTGPFFFYRSYPGEKVVLKRFEKYWGTPPKIDEIEIVVIPEELIALGTLEKGDVDIKATETSAGARRAEAIKGAYILTTKASPQLYQLLINHRVKPMDDVRVRRALAHGVDIKKVSRRIGKVAVPWPTPIAPSCFAGTDEFWRYDYDVEKAKKLLAEAGYPKGFELTFLYKKQGLFEPVVLEVKNFWDKIVNVKLVLVERAIFTQTLKKFEHHVAHWSTSRFTPFQFASRYMTGSSQPYFQYSNPEVDEVIRKARTARSDEEARKYWRLFQYMVAEDCVQIGVFNKVPVIAVRNNVKGVVPITTNLIDLTRGHIE
jgi:peptide/nickel transport system substrate-binding protein